MLRMKDVITGAYRRFRDGKPLNAPQFAGDVVRLSQMASLLDHREHVGQRTTIRQLHTLCEMEQPEALSMLAELRRTGVVAIEENTTDEFESVITLKQSGLNHLIAAASDKAA